MTVETPAQAAETVVGRSRADSAAPITANHLPVVEQERLAATRQLVREPISLQSLAQISIPSLAVVGASVALWIAFPPSHLRLIAVFCALAALTLALVARFETPRGFTTAAQLGFVPLMFVVSPALLIPSTCLTIALSWLPRIYTREMSLWRLLHVPRNAWFAVGPAWVLALLGATHATFFFLLVALGAQFTLDFIASSIMLRFISGVSWSENLKDAWIYGVDVAMSGVAFAVAVVSAHSNWAPLLTVPMIGVLAYFAHERSQRLAHLIELNESYRGTALLLGDVIGGDDEYTGIHSQEVVQLATSVADELALDPDQRRNTEFAALLHDVGKIAIPKEIINKPGKLTSEEWALMKTHAEEGERMLTRIGGFMTDVGRIVRSHHERWDGGGYPDNLVADQSPIESRIITICDSWNAMRTNRPYRQALSIKVALDEITNNTGTQFDPDVAAALLRVIEQNPPADFQPPADSVTEL